MIQKQTKNPHYSLFILLAVNFFMLSCQTAPKIPDAVFETSGFIPLEPGAFAYIFADVQNAKPILEYINLDELNDANTKQMIDRTRSAVAAVYLPQDKRRFQLSAWGDYPSFRAKMALKIKREWKKSRSPASGANFWYSAGRRLSLALNAGRAFVSAASEDTPIDPFTAAPGTEVPEGFGNFRKGAILSFWLEDPGPMINKKLDEMGLPLQLPADQMFVSLFPLMPPDASGGQFYQANIKIRFSSENQARSLVFLFAIAQNFIPSGPALDGSGALAAILFSNPPVQDGRDLIIQTNTLSGREIALLFNIFSL